MTPAFDYDQVADLYDDYVRYDDDLPFFLDACRTVEGPVLELMSGTGRVSVSLIEAGISLTCVDSSAEMLAILERKLTERGLAAPVVRQDVTRLDLPSKFNLAFIAFQAFAELVTEDEQRRALTAIHRTLNPGGRFICTLHNPTLRLKSVGKGPIVAGRVPVEDGQGEIVVTTDLHHDEAHSLIHGSQTIQKRSSSGKTLLERTVAIRFALIARPTFEHMAHEAGFDIESLHGDYQRTPYATDSSPYMIWTLRK